jgi:hypothetical protein
MVRLYLSIYGSIAFVDLGRFFSFLIYTQSVGLLGRGISSSEGRYLHRTTQIQNTRTQTSVPRMGFEPTISVFERAKTVHALDRASTVTGSEWAKTFHALDRAAIVSGSERAKTFHALDRAATVTGSERAKTVHALDRSATVTGSERAKTVHALDRAATVTGSKVVYELWIGKDLEENGRCLTQLPSQNFPAGCADRDSNQVRSKYKSILLPVSHSARYPYLNRLL